MAKIGGGKSGYEPTDKAKWQRAKAAAKRKFDVYPSAYANLWASKKYKEMGGKWRKKKKTKKSYQQDLLLKKIAGEKVNVREFVQYHGPYQPEKNVEIFDAVKDSYLQIFNKFKDMRDKYLADREGDDVDFDDEDLKKVFEEAEEFLSQSSSILDNLSKIADLRQWLKEKWVRIDKSKDGKHPPCGRKNADKGDYPKCVPKNKAKRMTKKEKQSASRRKEKAENKTRIGKKPHYVSTKPKRKKKSVLDLIDMIRK